MKRVAHMESRHPEVDRERCVTSREKDLFCKLAHRLGMFNVWLAWKLAVLVSYRVRAVYADFQA